MGTNAMIYWGWIPILTKKVHFEYGISKIPREGWEIASNEEKTEICQILGTDTVECYRHWDCEDENNKKFKIIVCIQNYKINNIFAYDSKGVIKAHAKCTIHDDGLVEIELDHKTVPIKEKIQPKVAKRVYISIRDVYHSHTHHTKYEDILLKPVLAANKDKAVERLLYQYDEKIIHYHKVIKPDIESHKDFDEARNLIGRAKGEMTYAVSFTRLFKRYINDFELYISVFSNSFQSITTLAETIESIYTNNLAKYTHDMTRALNALTLAIVALTAPIATDAAYGVLNHILYHFNLQLDLVSEIIVLSINILIVLGTCIIMRGWIREEIKRLSDRFFPNNSS
ncbi:MAG: hypothetical protein CHKLHMKO_00096 [Candidatus Argoarchaeum ethanivorans]|uniref:Uncharacterized protein n=1 Tax=Candidatus Argoarchaeum ethanivorans TaxID=2608793 RepID=A0A811T6F8_9EURY|nr:MAG: hypothetical protein CHKLHMKO_00096 [Candidatus Argoarchaeum ethanivorans]